METINEILDHKNKKLNQTLLEMCITEKAVKAPKLISNAYNDYFVTVGNTLSKNTKKPAASDCTFTEKSLIVNQSNSVLLCQIATLEVRNCIL